MMAQDNRKKARRRNGPGKMRYVPRQVRIGIVIAVTAVILVGLGAVALTQGWIRLPDFSKPADPNQETTPAAPPAADTVVHFVAGGDLNVTDKVISSGLSGGSYDYSGTFLDVLPVLAGGDVTALNFEGNLAGEPYGTQHNSAPQALMESLRNSGVDILQTANSKSITNGLLGLGTTASGIRNAGMEPLGTYASQEEYNQYQGFLIREVNGIRIAFVAFTKGMDGRGLPEGSEYSVNLLYTDYSSTYQKVDEEGITKVLKAVESMKPDVTVALLHWGSEFNEQISTSQKKIVKLMANQGVDAIIGTHSHYVQKMGFDEDTGIFVAYSLGDFLGDGEKSGTNYSILLDLEITKDGKTGKTEITDYSYTPIYLHADESGKMQLLRIQQAMAAYESNAVGRVSSEVYESMKYALSRIKDRVKG